MLVYTKQPAINSIRSGQCDICNITLSIIASFDVFVKKMIRLFNIMTNL